MSIYSTAKIIPAFTYYGSGESLVSKEPEEEFYLCNPVGEYGEVLRVSIDTKYSHATVLLDRDGIEHLYRAMKWQKKRRDVNLAKFIWRRFKYWNPLGKFQKNFRKMKRDNNRHAQDHGFKDSMAKEYFEWLIETHAIKSDGSRWEHSHEWQEKGEKK